MSIDKTAIIHPSAQIGDGVTIGASAVVEADVVVGDGCRLDAHAFIRRGVQMGQGNRVDPFAVIGGDPQDIGFNRQSETFVKIGDNNVFREHVTIHRSTVEGTATEIGSNCYFMNYSHAAHDCVVGDGCILANAVQLGGHVKVGAGVVFGAGAMAHQFCRIGSLAMVAAMIPIRKDILPYTMAGGEPVKHYRMNAVGIRRSGITRESVKAISVALRALRESSNQDIAGAESTEVERLAEWLKAESKRGIYGWVVKPR